MAELPRDGSAVTARLPTIVPLLELLRSALPRDVPDRTAEAILSDALAAAAREDPPPFGHALRAFIELSLRDSLRLALGDQDGDDVLDRIRRSSMPARTVLVASIDPELPGAIRAVLFREDVLVVVRDAESLRAWIAAARDERPSIVADLRDEDQGFGRTLVAIRSMLPSARILLWCGPRPGATPDLGGRVAVRICDAPRASGVARALMYEDDVP